MFAQWTLQPLGMNAQEKWFKWHYVTFMSIFPFFDFYWLKKNSWIKFARFFNESVDSLNFNQNLQAPLNRIWA